MTIVKTGKLAAIVLGAAVSSASAAPPPVAPAAPAAATSETISKEQAIKYVLATAKAFRKVYATSVVETAKKGGVRSAEGWQSTDHAIMLPAQFLKAAGAEIKDFEMTLVGLTPINQANLPKTPAETTALKKMAADSSVKLLSFTDGKNFVGMSADTAVAQSCVDCHNQHPNSPKKDFKKDQVLGAIVVRMKR